MRTSRPLRQLSLVLFEPDIPQNTGTIGRLCVAMGTPLHLIEPLGFEITDKNVKRAGLDYWKHLDLTIWPSWEAFYDQHGEHGRMIMSSAKSSKVVPYHQFEFKKDDFIIMGSETRGIPQWLLNPSEHPQPQEYTKPVLPLHRYVVKLPQWGQVRSLNIANAASVLLYEAHRQTDSFVLD